MGAFSEADLIIQPRCSVCVVGAEPSKDDFLMQCLTTEVTLIFKGLQEAVAKLH